MQLTKYIITNHILEVYTYENFTCGKGGKTKKENDSIEIPEEKEITELMLLNYKNHNKVRANMIRRLACANFNFESTFITFTFDDKKVNHDIHDVKECNKQFKQFIQRLKYYLKNKNILLDESDLKYLAVIEFQDKNDRRAVHYHCLFNFEYIDAKELFKIWGLGSVYIEKIRHVDNVGAYLIKYMTKDNDDERLMGLPAYLRSRNLIEPEEIICVEGKTNKAEEYYKIDTITANSKTIYEYEYDTEYLGKCTYKQYNLKRIEERS